jgi:peptide/nickel transport system substrate-binding protein
LRAAANTIAVETLATLAQDGQPKPWLAETWSTSNDGLVWRVRLRDSLRFHDGQALDATTVANILRQQLPPKLGPAADDIASIQPEGDRDIIISLKRRSAFVPEALDVPIAEPSHPEVGTGPFKVVSSDANGLDMEANAQYHLGRPGIDRIAFRPYKTLRAAWADIMRNTVDVVYDVDPNVLDLLQPSSTLHVFDFHQRYVWMMVFNNRRAMWHDKSTRRALNAAVDRDALIADALKGHAVPATGPVWPQNWAYDPAWPNFGYDPALAAVGTGSANLRTTNNRSGKEGLRFECWLPDAVPERLVVVLQHQLYAVGFDMQPKVAAISEFNKRFTSGDFDAVLLPALMGPNLLRAYQWWHTGAPYNFGDFRGAAVDASLDDIRHAADPTEYKMGVERFQRAIVDDPPAIFLAWSDRARVVNSRFAVAPDPSGDVLKTLRLWRPADPRVASRN